MEHGFKRLEMILAIKRLYVDARCCGAKWLSEAQMLNTIEHTLDRILDADPTKEEVEFVASWSLQIPIIHEEDEEETQS